MNLHNIASAAIGAVNPMILANVQASTGYVTSADGKRVEAYAPADPVLIQIQALQYNDIVQLDGLNIQGVRRKIYIKGNWNGVVRVDGKGGDLLTFPEFPGGPSRTWLAVCVLEHWPHWTCLAVTLQNQ